MEEGRLPRGKEESLSLRTVRSGNTKHYLLDNLVLPVYIQQELEFQKSKSSQSGDKFVSVVSQFITVASFSFSDVEDSLTEAKELVSVVDFPVVRMCWLNLNS